jgi:hypothetical protein
MVVAPSYHPFGIYDSDTLMFYKAIILSGFASYNPEGAEPLVLCHTFGISAAVSSIAHVPNNNPEGVEPLYKAILSSAVSSLRDLLL